MTDLRDAVRMLRKNAGSPPLRSSRSRSALASRPLGCVGALLVTRLIRNMLFGVSATDGVTYLAVGLLIGAVVLLAAWIPARRAMRIDPMVALRTE